MTDQPLTMMRCERCRAVLSSADAPALIRAGTPCGVCGGVLALAGAYARAAAQGGLGDVQEHALPRGAVSVGGGVLPDER
ncbi:MAG TPA: hypothetical protein VM299_00225 [Solirubrobacteraceae bacterium]|nr:hypothetical protein [Solirubrobacteraceae bacterium]